MNRELFGDNSHYYSNPCIPERKSGEHGDTPLENRIRQLLASQQVDVKDRVEQVCRQANLAVREYLRSETALKLSQAERRQAVPYQVVDGIPRSLAIKLEELPDPILLLLLQKRQLLNNGESALSLVTDYFPDILRILVEKSSIEKVSLEISKLFIQETLKKLDAFNLPDLIKAIDEDVLGAYFFRVPTIQIYWMPIGMVAGILDVSVEDLSFVVLAHELAHAYTHVGLDIDGVQWETEVFAGSSKMIVEGLAQFYTESICNKYANRQPGILKAFKKLLEKQPEPYTHFRNWTKEHAAEVVRFSMISARSNNIREYEHFEKEMNDIEQRIRVKHKQSRSFNA